MDENKKPEMITLNAKDLRNLDMTDAVPFKSQRYADADHNLIRREIGVVVKGGQFIEVPAVEGNSNHLPSGVITVEEAQRLIVCLQKAVEYAILSRQN